MFFTREDIEKIHQSLLSLGVKDSELPSTTNINSDDVLTVVQEGKNKKINIEEFFNNISLFKKEGFINITDRFNKHSISLIEAIQTVPAHQKIDGLVITFEDINRDWRIYQFRGDTADFFDESKWTDLYDYTNYIVDSITPDEEDLTVSKPDKEGNAVVSLKDRVYDESNFSGKGYRIVRKNILEIDGTRKNILTQDMINEPNTVYEIRYNFDLNNKEIIIPKGCILKFNGGKLTNGSWRYSSKYNKIVKASEVGFLEENSKGANIFNGTLFVNLMAANIGIDFENNTYNFEITSVTNCNFIYIKNGTINITLNNNTYYVFKVTSDSKDNPIIHIENITIINSGVKDVTSLLLSEDNLDFYYDYILCKNSTFKSFGFARFNFGDFNSDVHKVGVSNTIIRDCVFQDLLGTFYICNDAYYNSVSIEGNYIRNSRYTVFYYAVTNEYKNHNLDKKGKFIFKNNKHINDSNFLASSTGGGYICSLLIEGNEVYMSNNVFENIRAFNNVVYAFYVSSTYFECTNNTIKNVFNFNQCTYPVVKLNYENSYNEIFKSKGGLGTWEKPDTRIFTNNTVIIERDNYINAMKLSSEFPEDYAHYNEVQLFTSLFRPMQPQNITFINNDINIEGVLSLATSTEDICNIKFNDNRLKFFNASIFNGTNPLSVLDNTYPYSLINSVQCKYVTQFEICGNIFECTNSNNYSLLAFTSFSVLDSFPEDNSIMQIKITNNIGNNVVFYLPQRRFSLESTKAVKDILVENNTSNLSQKTIQIRSSLTQSVYPTIGSVKIKGSYIINTVFLSKLLDLDLDISRVISIQSGDYKALSFPFICPILDSENECYLLEYTRKDGISDTLEIYRKNRAIYVTAKNNIEKPIKEYLLSNNIYLVMKSDQSYAYSGIVLKEKDSSKIEISIWIGINNFLQSFKLRYYPYRMNIKALKGQSSLRPSLDTNDEGYEFYDSTLKKKILWNGSTWTNLDGSVLT